MIVPERLLQRVGFSDEVESSVERGAIVLQKPAAPVRAGWAEDSKRIAAAGGDALVWPQFGNEDDAELVW